MTPDTTALRLAIRLNSLPSQVRAARQQPLPPGMPLLLAAAAGDPEALDIASRTLERSVGDVTASARFFVEQVMLVPGGSSYRALGLGPDAAAADLRRHFAWCLKFLHPDRDPVGDRASLALRVTSAWDDLKTPERREAYDRALQAREHMLAAQVREAEASRTARKASRSRRTKSRAVVAAPIPSAPVEPRRRRRWMAQLFRSLF